MPKLHELRSARAAAVDALTSLAAADKFDRAAFTAKEAEIEGLDGQIDALEKAQARQASLATPHGAANTETEEAYAGNGRIAPLGRSHDGRLRGYDDYLGHVRRSTGFSVDKSRHFMSLGEQLQAIQQYYTSRGSNSDTRLVRAPTGAGEIDPTGGGFLIQTDFATSVFMLAHDMGELMSRVNMIPISANANGLKIPGVDETSRATGSRWGGVQSNWAAEGVAGTESRPKYRLIEFDLKKLISKMTMTDELLRDVPALTAIASQAFSEEIMFMTEDAIFEGTGAGQPLGIINSPALVSVPKAAGQLSGTVVKDNIDSMWARCWARSRKIAVWYINQDVEPQLTSLSQTVGTGGQIVYLPPGGLSAAPYATLYGRPVVAVEYCAALGSVGDIVLADLSQYTIIDKGGVQAATSMHVAFDTDEMRFRITYRVDGKPMWAAPMTPFKGTLTKSPFVALAAR